MTVFVPVCTCAVPGIQGCAKHPVEPKCDCPPGWKHQPDCYLVTGQEDDDE